ncbi:MAG TPA: hypothetical protein VMB71_02490 [Acetobacteraceae bacterium]|nr:hypothetical protein [Acetobacteraceae bacterium]
MLRLVQMRMMSSAAQADCSGSAASSASMVLAVSRRISRRSGFLVVISAKASRSARRRDRRAGPRRAGRGIVARWGHARGCGGRAFESAFEGATGAGGGEQLDEEARGDDVAAGGGAGRCGAGRCGAGFRGFFGGTFPTYSYPFAGLLPLKGAYYGTTGYGGSFDSGTVYKFTP